MTQRTYTVVGGRPPPAVAAEAVAAEAAYEGKLREHPVLRPFLKLLKVGLPMGTAPRLFSP